MCGSATLAMVASRVCIIVARMIEPVSRALCGTASGSRPAELPSRIALLISVPERGNTPAAGIDGGADAHAGAQWQPLLCVYGEAHRQALNHLDPVARGIFRRQ